MADNVQIQGIEFEVIGVSEQAANGLKPLISSLNKLKRITANGLGLKAIVQEIKDFNSALGNGETPLTGLANAINQISSSSHKLGSVHTHLDAISQLDFSNLTLSAISLLRRAVSGDSVVDVRVSLAPTSRFPTVLWILALRKWAARGKPAQ